MEGGGGEREKEREHAGWKGRWDLSIMHDAEVTLGRHDVCSQKEQNLGVELE
jgi:hypothetical protein